jgi:hypothetical protein
MKNTIILGLILFLPLSVWGGELKGTWVLEKSEITYQVTHPLHEVIGKSVSARGKGICKKGDCQFLVAVPVKSFDSGDGNRDLHMLQITRGVDFPLIQVNTQFMANTAQLPRTITADWVIQFAGKKATYPQVALTVEPWHSTGAHITGTLPLHLKDFDISPPALLGVPIRDTVPVKLDLYWRKAEPTEK